MRPPTTVGIVFYPGQVAQSVEQRTENPRVGGSIPSLATTARLLRALEVIPIKFMQSLPGNQFVRSSMLALIPTIYDHAWA